MFTVVDLNDKINGPKIGFEIKLFWTKWMDMNVMFDFLRLRIEN